MDACHTFRGKHKIGGIVFYKHTYLVIRIFVVFVLDRLLRMRMRLTVLLKISLQGSGYLADVIL